MQADSQLLTGLGWGLALAGWVTGAHGLAGEQLLHLGAGESVGEGQGSQAGGELHGGARREAPWGRFCPCTYWQCPLLGNVLGCRDNLHKLECYPGRSL